MKGGALKGGCPEDTPPVGQQAGGTHHTRIHSCDL